MQVKIHLMDSNSVDRRLDTAIEETGFDAYFQFDDSSNNNHRYVSGFDASDTFGFLRHDVKSTLLVAPLEKNRAKEESKADEIRSTTEFVTDDVRDDIEAEANVVQQFLKEYDIEHLAVPHDFDLFFAEKLEKSGIKVESISDIIMDARVQKSNSELEALQTAQMATEDAMSYAEGILRDSQADGGVLHYKREVLTSERLRSKVQQFLMDRQCSLDEAIIACGQAAADPHEVGSGPLRINEPILFDIYPQHESGYWGDMSRTFVKGTPSSEFVEMYETTQTAFECALEILSDGAGVTGAAVHNAVCEIFEQAGYQTIREGDIEEGFLHSTGHAIGLDLHEPPRLVDGTGELNNGTVLTVEPGLYDKEHGGVRIEDMIVVEEEGYRNLNDYSHDWKL